jgi:hypothetical protein
MRKAWAAVPLATALLAACPDFGALSGGSAPTDGGAATDGACSASQKSCVGKCVDQSDPNVGCSGECSVCAAAPNAQAACVLQNNSEVCGTGTCNPQYGDCDNLAENGCETHTTTSAHCGSCGTECGALYCVLQGESYTCSASCDPPNKLCPSADGKTQDCANLPSDNMNCGDCGVSCVVSNGAGTCSGSKCAITCNTNYFLCGGACILPSNDQCGSSCGGCPVGKSCDVRVGSTTYGTCITTGSGGVKCDAGTNLTEDPNCGACGVDCAAKGTKCCSGGFFLDGGAAPSVCKSSVATGCTGQ